jgi:diguanylate cyclase (GGDEF)-like protein
VARSVSQTIQRSGDFLARYGGEEMVVLLPNTAGQAAMDVAHRVLGAVRSAGLVHAASDAATCVTLSIGVACVVPRSLDATDEGVKLLAQADAALYEAKRRGRNTAVLA